MPTIERLSTNGLVSLSMNTSRCFLRLVLLGSLGGCGLGAVDSTADVIAPPTSDTLGRASQHQIDSVFGDVKSDLEQILGDADELVAPTQGSEEQVPPPTSNSTVEKAKLSFPKTRIASKLPRSERPRRPNDDSSGSSQAPRPAPTPSDAVGLPQQSPSRSLPPAPQTVKLLQRPVERALRSHFNKRLNSADNSCWSMMHSFLGWGEATQIHVGGPRGRRTNAIHWVGNNQPCAGRRLFYLDGDRIRGREGPGYQGHPAQFLAMLAQCAVEPTVPLSVNGRGFTVADLIEEEKQSCASGTELTFRLISFSHYLNTSDRWVSRNGERWSVERLLAEELSQPVNGAACGGTHRLMGMSCALAKRRDEGAPVDGTWKTADDYIRNYHRYTLTLANRDGSFSSDWFKKRSAWGDLDRRLQTTGHILEWLVFSLPDEAVFDHRVSRAVNFLATSLTQHRHHEWEVGPKGHAIRALRLYHQRVYQRLPLTVHPLAQKIDWSSASH